MSTLLYRVEHSNLFNPYLISYHANCTNEKDIGAGPWTCLDLFTSDEFNMFAEFSLNHAPPYPTNSGREHDDYIYQIVKGPDNMPVNQIKENFVFGCSAVRHIVKYFPVHIRQMLIKNQFNIGIYQSDFIYTSKFQSVMDISKPFAKIGSCSLDFPYGNKTPQLR